MKKANQKITAKQRKISEKSLANLKPWPTGQSGNPAGRKKGSVQWAWSDLIYEYGDQQVDAEYANKLDLAKDATWKHVVVAMAYRHAAKGNAAILRELIERVDGRIPINLKITAINELIQKRIELQLTDEQIRSRPALHRIFVRYGLLGDS